MAEAEGSSRQPVPEALQLHGSDHPGMILVSALLTKHNYLTWSYAVKRALRAKLKLGFIDGTCVKPHMTDPLFEHWVRVDSMVTTWILNCISKEIVNSFMYAKSARTLWLDLEERYGECNGPLLYQLQREITSLTQRNMSVVEYFSKLRMVWDELDMLLPTPQCTCGGCTCGLSKAIVDQAIFTRLIQFLMGLSETFDHLRDQLLVMDPVPTVNKAYSMVLRVEKQREVHMDGADAIDNVAMQVRGGGRREFVPRSVQRKILTDKRSQYCNHCDRSGHTRETCFKLHGTPDWYKDLAEKKKKEGGTVRGYNVQMEDQQLQHKTHTQEALMQELIRLMKPEGHHMQLQEDPLQANFAQLDNFAGKNCAFASFKDGLSDSWIVDTGATNHMCAHKHIIHSILSPCHSTLVHLPDGTTQSVTHTGSVTLHPTLVLTDVLYIPNFKYNLLSVPKLCSHSSIEVKFYSSYCVLQDLVTKRIIAIGKLFQNLYVLDKSSFSPSTIASFTAAHNKSCINSVSCNNVLWHRRLGHPSFNVLKHVPEVKSIDPTDICMICPLAKQSRLPFSTCAIQSKRVFELIHVDLWGPYRTQTYNGCNYFLTIVDDFSRATWTFLLRYKTQVCHTLDMFFKMILTQFESKIQFLRSDNGTEFTNTSCHSLFNSLGILHQKSCPHTPQQNGVVERKHRHILEVARALKFQANLPSKYWGETILAATYLINRLPTQLLNWKSPYEVLYKKPPSYSNFKVFGCLCFASNTLPSKQKFDARAYRCIFLGYSQHHKAYKVLDLTRDLVFHSRDVIFHENIFPFNSVSASTKHVPVPSPPSYHSDSDDKIYPDTSSHLTPDPNLGPPTATDITSQPLQNDSHSTPISVCVPSPRRSQRIPKKPLWLDDYVCNCVSHSDTTCYPSTFTSAHMSFVASLSSVQEPRSYPEASKDARWVAAMNDELSALDKNETWELVPLPPGKRAIGSKWVFKLKLNPDGSVQRYKARLVAKGYNQIEGIDYFDSFSPVAKSVTVRVFMAVAVAKGWPLWQLDVNNAFLHGHLDEEVYMVPPEVKGYYTLFTILGSAKYFLGLELARSAHGLLVTQQNLTDILTDVTLLDAKVTSTPLPPGLHLTTATGSLLPDPGPYRRLIGRLLYLGFTRPDISFAVQQLSQFIQHPRSSHWDAAVHVLRYLKGTSALGLFFPSSNTLQPSVFTDASWHPAQTLGVQPQVSVFSWVYSRILENKEANDGFSFLR
ncbi:UNVERIFIED_CONTAM: Retrovirus-related Pol polyprotein from transposon RE1 [Sesamum radiatum]|uniref:Retrovirus-related Pol polyprotein from transposon RE1 n=1 Tax=Sesamum radiatum TaxID=300843 RepID=A0AAW2JXA0_SESRA